MPIQIPAWPDPATDEGAAFFAAARKFHSLYRAAGNDRPFAFGLMTMAEAESSFDPNALGDWEINGVRTGWKAHRADYPPGAAPISFGAHQRKADRCNAIRDGRKGVPGLGFDIAALALAGQNTIENEVRSVLWELAAFPMGYGSAAIRGAKTAYGVAYNATVMFEKAGTVADGAAEKRGAMAETWVMLASGIWPTSRGPRPAGWEALTQGWG